MPGNKQQPVLAVDLGGTKTIVAVVLPTGKIISRKYYLTLADEGTRAVLNRLSSAINQSIAQARLKNTELIGIGIAAAGILDTRKGIV
ncbi:MAG: ROK family protein, partial [Dehalococcoidia bacterium]